MDDPYPQTTAEPLRGVPEHVTFRLGSGMTMSDDDEKSLLIRSLSDAQLIAILQQDDSDEKRPAQAMAFPKSKAYTHLAPQRDGARRVPFNAGPPCTAAAPNEAPITTASIILNLGFMTNSSLSNVWSIKSLSQAPQSLI
jgi:hypothetical protein